MTEGKAACDAKAVDEAVLQDAFVRVFNRIKEDKSNFIQALNQNIEKVLMKKADEEGVAKIDARIEELKQELKGLVQLQLKGQMDVEVYQEEQMRIGAELEELREQKREMEKVQDTEEQYSNECRKL